MRRLRFALFAACLGGLLTGCGASASVTSSYTIQSTHIAGLGNVLADGHGHILYIYVPDDQGPSRCFSGCANAWPPVVLPRGVRRPLAGSGIDPRLLGTVSRGRSLQVTYNRWPLYRYIDDRPGQVNGQAEDMGAWYVLSPSGDIDRQVASIG